MDGPSRKKMKGSKKKKSSMNVINTILLLIAGCSVALIVFSNIQMSRVFSSGSTGDCSTAALSSTFVGSFLDSALLSSYTNSFSQAAAVEPFDLSVNHLQVISFWNGSLPLDESLPGTKEDFLPVVTSQHIALRFRLRPLPKTTPDPNDKDGRQLMEAIRGVSAYQIIAQLAHDPSKVLWNSGKVINQDKDFILPMSFEWDLHHAPLKEGTIVRWRALVWDALGQGPSSSGWSKFAVGPDEWKAKWITHPVDYSTLFKPDGTPRVRPDFHDRRTTPEMCSLWEKRRPLPIARAKFEVQNPKEIVGALLVASGLGVFSVSMNGKKLSSSSVQDPPLTDFAQRVSYRGYDVTEELTRSKTHVVGISLASGWWDHRPVNGAIVFMDFMPKGSLTTVAQLHLTMRNGSTKVLIPTGGSDGTWTMGKGSVIESNLYTGEHVDLEKLATIQGWDTVNQPSEAANAIGWVAPQLYESGGHEEWLKLIEDFAVNRKNNKQSAVGPIGKLQPIEQQPVMPIRKIAAESIIPLGTDSGRWLVDFGVGMSGVVRFENGLPEPFKPIKYPRAHDLTKTFDENARFVSIVYGDSLEMPTGDINLALVAGFGHHSGGERNVSKTYDVDQRGGPCFPKEDLIGYQALTQRDVFVLPQHSNPTLFSKARQASFSVHGFRYAEVCCTKEPPTDAFAIQYRTAFPTWGHFDSSNIVFNGAYELTRNAIESNTIGVQSDCPHRERLQYGGDLISASPAALHMYDMSGMYRKVVFDWIDTQFSNGAYTVTAFFMDLLDYTSVAGRGSGETIWASAPPVVTARHMRHYGDTKMAMDTLYHHTRWIEFLATYWDEGIKRHYGSNLTNYWGTHEHGLGDWLGLAGIDTWFSHHAFYLAAVRSVAYIAKKLLDLNPNLEKDTFSKHAHEALLDQSLTLAKEIETTILDLYKGDQFSLAAHGNARLGQDMGLFTRIVQGPKRCSALQSFVSATGNEMPTTWPGDEEQLFHKLMRKSDYNIMLHNKLLSKMGDDKTFSRYTLRNSLTSGIFGMKYTLKTLSENGFHSLALSKANGPCPHCFPGFGMMMSFDATTMWETYWRSEDIYSRNHPMFGAIAEWLAESVAGIQLAPTTIGGTELLLYPQIPTTIKSASILHFASAVQGTKRGDAAIAWKLLNTSATSSKNVVVRMLVPPSSTAELRLPTLKSKASKWRLRRSIGIPDFAKARIEADFECNRRRENKEGYHHYWHYDPLEKEYSLTEKKRAIGTPCESFLFLPATTWTPYQAPTGGKMTVSTSLGPGLYEATIDNWELEEDVVAHGYEAHRDTKFDVGSFCSDPSTFHWDINDAEHLA